MKSTQYQFVGSPSNHIQIDGMRSIIILYPTKLKMKHPSKLKYYRGSVKSGSHLNKYDGCHAIIFKKNKHEAIEEFYEMLLEVNHPCVIRPLGFAYGVGKDDSNCCYLALEPFATTFAAYAQKKGLGVDVNGRFTEEMITLISDIISGMEDLHWMGYYCPSLKGDDIAVVIKGASVTAKILMFRLCAAGLEEVQKDDDWPRLGLMLEEVAWTCETRDLVNKLKRGQLKGQSILKHGALLTVRKKVHNTHALFFHTSVNYPEDPNQSQSTIKLEASEICATNLETDLDKKLVWTTPAFAPARVTQKTLRGFLRQLRIFFEHQSKFIPPELTMKEILELRKAKDLDHQLQELNGELCLAVQDLAGEMNLKY